MIWYDTVASASLFQGTKGIFIERDRYFEESDLDEERALRYFPHCGDEDYDFFQCPHCHKIYLFEYEAEAIFRDPLDGNKTLFPNDLHSDLFCVSCGYNFKNDILIGKRADARFKVTLAQIVAGGWGFLLNEKAVPDPAFRRTMLEARNLDASLLDSGIVDAELFLRFIDAYSCDSAASIGWLNDRLHILRDRLAEGRSVSVTGENLEGLTTIDTLDDFREWVGRHFPLCAGKIDIRRD